MSCVAKVIGSFADNGTGCMATEKPRTTKKLNLQNREFDRLVTVLPPRLPNTFKAALLLPEHSIVVLAYKSAD